MLKEIVERLWCIFHSTAKICFLVCCIKVYKIFFIIMKNSYFALEICSKLAMLRRTRRKKHWESERGRWRKKTIRYAELILVIQFPLSAFRGEKKDEESLCNVVLSRLRNENSHIKLYMFINMLFKSKLVQHAMMYGTSWTKLISCRVRQQTHKFLAND